MFEGSIYFAVRLCIEATWLNDRDQFLYLNDGWKADGEFPGDCLVFTLFHGQNLISCEHGVNHWIPFTEDEVGAQDCFASHFMSDFLAGKLACGHAGRMTLPGLDDNPVNPVNPVEISAEARAVLDAGRELWRYYHAQPKANPNASYYDIRRHFQGMKKTASGKEQMNATSDDERYSELLSALKSAMKTLAKQIEPKVYAYGFLRR